MSEGKVYPGTRVNALVAATGPVCANGFPAFTSWAAVDTAIKSNYLDWLTIPLKPINGIKRSVKILCAVRFNDLFTNFVQDWDEHVLEVQTAECEDPRPINGTQIWSCHAGAGVVDTNPATLPQHVRSFDGQRIAWAHQVLGWYAPVMEWGGDWSSAFLDEMHNQVAQDSNGDGVRIISDAQIAAVVAKGRYIRPPAPPKPHPTPSPTPVPRPYVTGDDMAVLIHQKKKGFTANAQFVLTIESGVAVLRWITDPVHLNQLMAAGAAYHAVDQVVLDGLTITGAQPPAG